MLLAVRLVKVDWCASIRLLLVKLLVQFIVCLFWCRSVISRLQGAGDCWHRFSGVCSKLVNQLSGVSR